MSRQCADCGVDIPAIRLEILPDTEWCVGCSDRYTFKYVARTIYPHKTGGELFVAKSKEDARRLVNESNRKR